MFGWSKKRKMRLMQRMSNLTNAANIINCLALLHEYKGQFPSETDDQQYARAAAVTNYIYDMATSPEHATKFGDEWISGEANRRLNASPLLMELAIQTLRVKNTVRFGETGSSEPLIGADFLEAYGMKYPQALYPNEYLALIDRVQGSLPPEYCSAVVRFRKQHDLYY